MSTSQDSIPRSGASIAAAAAAAGITIADNKFTITGSSDATKTFKVECDAASTGVDVTLDLSAQTIDCSFLFPVVAASDTLMVLGTAQTVSKLKTFDIPSASTAVPVLVEDYRVSSTGTPAAGFGTSQVCRAASATVANRAHFEFQTQWVVATDATRTSRSTFYQYDFSGFHAVMKLDANGVAGFVTLGEIATTCPGQIIAGVQDGTAAIAGQVGERIRSQLTGVAVGATGVTANLTSITPTRGDWLIGATVVIAAGATGLTAGSTLFISVVAVSAGTGVSGYTLVQQTIPTLVPNGLYAAALPLIDTGSLAAATTFYVTAYMTYAAGTPTADVSVIATRIR